MRYVLAVYTLSFDQLEDDIMGIQLCIVLLLCAVSTNLTAAASVIDRDTVKCDQELCDAKTEYCDPLIDVCTSCELPCSRTTVSDTNLCKTLCAGK